MSFNKAILRVYAQRENPESLPPNIYFTHTKDTVTIFDAFPKAIFHFLVLPRVGEEPYSATNLTSLKKFLTSTKIKRNDAEELVKSLKADAEDVKKMIEEEMVERFGFKWPVYMGFHAVQSMDHIHLHVISQDFCSPSLKTKKHYNSFHPKLGYFLHVDDVLAWFEKGKADSYYQLQLKSESAFEKKLKEPLMCFKCEREIKNMPTLKEHLQGHFDKSAKASQDEPVEPKEPDKFSRKRSTSNEVENDNSGESADDIVSVVNSDQPPNKRRRASPN